MGVSEPEYLLFPSFIRFFFPPQVVQLSSCGSGAPGQISMNPLKCTGHVPTHCAGRTFFLKMYLFFFIGDIVDKT